MLSCNNSDSIDGLEGLKVEVDLLFLALVLGYCVQLFRRDVAFKAALTVKMVPQYTMRPFGGTLLYSLSLCCVDVIAAKTERRLTRDLMFEAVPYSVASMFVACEICERGGLPVHAVRTPSHGTGQKDRHRDAQDERDHGCSSTAGSFEALH